MKEETKLGKIKQLESEKLAELAGLREKLTTLNAERGELLVSFATGEKGASESLAALQKTRSECMTQIEALEAMLKSFPKQVAAARAEEIEAEITELEKVKTLMAQQAPELDRAAENFVLELKKHRDLINDLKARNPWAFDRIYPGASTAPIPYFMEKHGLVKVDPRAGNASQVDGLETSLLFRRIDVLIHNMQESAKELRGEPVDNKLGYCSNCHGVGNYASPNSSKIICAKCGTTIRE